MSYSLWQAASTRRKKASETKSFSVEEFKVSWVKGMRMIKDVNSGWISVKSLIFVSLTRAKSGARMLCVVEHENGLSYAHSSLSRLIYA